MTDSYDDGARFTDATKRFSNRVDAYIRYRPGYPDAIVELLKTDYGLSSDHEIADIGAGVGHSALLFAPHVNYIYGIEPNNGMYEALVQRMAHYANFSARLQSAENTDLEARSVDFIICGQSYHWFDKRMVKTEFERIINDEGYIVLIWNSRKRKTPFGQAYEQILKDYSIDYEQVDHADVKDEDFDYLMSTWKLFTYDNSQIFDLEGLIGRYTSTSYALPPDSEGYTRALEALGELFETFSYETEEGRRVTFEYDTLVVVGKI